MRKVKWYLKKEQLVKDDSYRKLASKFLEKARQNLVTMSVLSELNDNKEVMRLLKTPKDYDSNEWVVITGYYAMYTAASSLLAKIGYKSKNHTATLCVLEEFFVKKEVLDKEILNLLRLAKFHKEEVEKLSDARHKREIAQYSITKKTTKLIAEKIKRDAYDFINKCEEIIENLE